MAEVSVNLDRLISQFPRYEDAPRVKLDVTNVSRHIRTLIPRRGVLTLNGGQQRELIMLEGTVATFFRGTQYNTPVEIYITESYPAAPPTCYIRPTQGMSLKKGHRHVDQSGLVYLPYLHEWQGRTHNLVELCAHMSSVFGAEPPLFASSRSAQPSGGGSSTSGRQSFTRPAQQTPSYTQAAAVPSHGAMGSAAGINGGYSANFNTSSFNRPTPTPTLPPKPRPEDVRREKEQAVTLKLQMELQGIYGKLRTEIDTAFETQARLEDNKEDVEADVEELSRRKNELIRLAEVTQERCLELETYLEERKKEGEPTVDELIEPKDSLSEQMLGLVVENASFEDGLYYLDRGFTDGVIALPDFLAQVRKLSRKQFIARATIKKVERAQQEKNLAKAQFNAQQQASNRESGTYPRLPQQQAANPPRYGDVGGPPPYTPIPSGGSYPAAGPRTSYNQGLGPAAAGTASAAWRGSAGVGAAGVAGSYAYGAGYGGSYGAAGAGYGTQSSNTQRR